jgi:hypothetical protein
MKRDVYQRRSYAARRMGNAVNRFVSATDFIERDKARKWVEAWRFFSGIRKPADVAANGAQPKTRMTLPAYLQ